MVEHWKNSVLYTTVSTSDHVPSLDEIPELLCGLLQFMPLLFALGLVGSRRGSWWWWFMHQCYLHGLSVSLVAVVVVIVVVVTVAVLHAAVLCTCLHGPLVHWSSMLYAVSQKIHISIFERLGQKWPIFTGFGIQNSMEI